jgi:TM2 domain-containing membrane protein YozV
MVHCRGCGKEIHETAITCPNCGAPQANPAGASDKRMLPAFLLCFLIGWTGAHRYYVGKIGTGVLMFFTLGGCGIWVLIDLIMIIVGAFTDKQGRKLTVWT